MAQKLTQALQCVFLLASMLDNISLPRILNSGRAEGKALFGFQMDRSSFLLYFFICCAILVNRWVILGGWNGSALYRIALHPLFLSSLLCDKYSTRYKMYESTPQIYLMAATWTRPQATFGFPFIFVSPLLTRTTDHAPYSTRMPFMIRCSGLVIFCVAAIQAFSPSSTVHMPLTARLAVATSSSSSSTQQEPATDRTIVDQSTLTLLEHVNLNVPSHEFIIPFYFDLLKCGMDPRKVDNLQPEAPKRHSGPIAGLRSFIYPTATLPNAFRGTLVCTMIRWRD